MIEASSGDAYELYDDISIVPIRVAILDVANDPGDEVSFATDVVSKRVVLAGHIVAEQISVAPDSVSIHRRTKIWMANPDIDVIVTIGGAGMGPRDITTDAMRELFSREFEAFGLVWHTLMFPEIGLATLTTRVCAGIARGKIVYCLPDHVVACRTGWDRMIRWQLDNRHQPGSLVELLPRFARPETRIECR